MNQQYRAHIIRLQKQVTIANRALERIAHGTSSPTGIAMQAIDDMQCVEMGKTHAVTP